MVSMNRIRKELGQQVCRRCINQKYKVNLEPQDCDYYIYPAECSVCKQASNIVTGLRASGKLKMLTK